MISVQEYETWREGVLAGQDEPRKRSKALAQATLSFAPSKTSAAASGS